MKNTNDSYNLDGFGDRLNNIFGVLSSFNNSGSDDGNQSINYRLNPGTLCYLYNSDPLIAKFVDKYPDEARNNGYKVLNNSGDIIEENNELILSMLNDALKFSRIYGRCYLYTIFDSDNDIPIKKNDKLLSYGMSYYAEHENDDNPFYTIENEKYHKSKVHHIIYKKTYKWDVNKNDESYQISLIQQIYNNLDTYVSSVRTGKYILQNLSYLLMGIKNLSAKTKNKSGLDEVLERLVSIVKNRNVTRSVAYDKDNEELSFISQTISGFDTVVDAIKTMLLASNNYPYDQIFEDRGNNGLGSGTQNQLINRMMWGEKKKTWSENNFLPILNKIYKLTYGENIKVEIPYKVSLTRLEQVELEKIASERNKNLIESKVVSPIEVRSGYEGADFSLNIRLDNEAYKQLSLTDESVSRGDNLPDDNTQDDSIYTDAELSDQEWEDLSNITTSDINRTARGVLNA